METTFSITSAVGDGWKLFKANHRLLLKMMLTVGLLQLASTVFDTEHVQTSGDVIVVMIGFVAGVLGAICMIGVLSSTIKIARGENTEYKDLMPTWHALWRFVLASLVMGICILLGFVLLIIPGVYLMLRFAFVRHIIVDMPKVGVFDSLRKSGEMTRGIKWELLGLLLVLVVLNIAGLIALGVGLLVTVPVTLLALSKVYVSLLAKAPLSE